MAQIRDVIQIAFARERNKSMAGQEVPDKSILWSALRVRNARDGFVDRLAGRENC